MADRMGFDEVFAVCLEGLEGGQGIAELLRRYPEHAQELSPLLETAVWFGGKAAAFGPRPGFVPASRSRVVQQIAAQPVAAGGWLERTWGQLFSGSRSAWRLGFLAAVAMVMLVSLVAGGSGIAYASQTALPGDALYSVKLGLERVELLVTLDPQAELLLHMQFSQLRLAEMQRLLALGRYEDLSIATANYRYHTSQALALLRQLAAESPAQATLLVLGVIEELRSQGLRMGILAGLAPQAARVQLGLVAQAAQEGAEAAGEIGEGAGIPVPTESRSGGGLGGAPTLPPTATEASLAMATPTQVNPPSLTPSPTPTRTPTPGTTPTPTQTAFHTATATVTPSRTAIPTATRTGQPTPTRTTRPTATRTGQPTPTRTPQPTPTRTGQPTPTRTSPPTPTRTSQPTPTRTSQPTPTRTSQPSPTATLPVQTPTATDLPPTPTRTPQPTNTPEPTPYPGPGVYPPPGG